MTTDEAVDLVASHGKNFQHGYLLNQDACALCGMSGLEMLQSGPPSAHVCSQERREAYLRKVGWDEWLYQARYHFGAL